MQSVPPERVSLSHHHCFEHRPRRKALSPDLSDDPYIRGPWIPSAPRLPSMNSSVLLVQKGHTLEVITSWPNRLSFTKGVTSGRSNRRAPGWEVAISQLYSHWVMMLKWELREESPVAQQKQPQHQISAWSSPFREAEEAGEPTTTFAVRS